MELAADSGEFLVVPAEQAEIRSDMADSRTSLCGAPTLLPSAAGNQNRPAFHRNQSFYIQQSWSDPAGYGSRGDWREADDRK